MITIEIWRIVVALTCSALTGVIISLGVYNFIKTREALKKIESMEMKRLENNN